MTPFAEVDPAGAALATLLVATGLGSFTLLCIGGVLRTWRRRRQEEWLMRERLAWWRRGLDTRPGSGGSKP